MPVPTAYVDAPASDGSFSNDPALSGLSTYDGQSNVIVMYLLRVPTAFVDAPVSDGPLYRLIMVHWSSCKSPSRTYTVEWNMRSIVPISKINFTD